MSKDTLKLPEGSPKLKVEPVQVPPALHGNHSMTPRQVDVAQNVNPATGLPYVQVGPRPATQISPPPTKNFR